MSSFIISNKTMLNIINGLFWNSEFKQRTTILARNGYNEAKDFQKLGNKFFKMNRKAVDYRYNEKELAEIFFWENNKLPNEFQVLKSMQCLHYQCSEGNVPKTKLFKFLESLIESWQDMILSQIQEYKDASWDAE